MVTMPLSLFVAAEKKVPAMASGDIYDDPPPP